MGWVKIHAPSGRCLASSAMASNTSCKELACCKLGN